MTKISALSDIGTSVASNDTFVLVDVSDPTTPNKKIQQQNILAAGGLLPDGSAGTPGLRFLNDTNTGLYSPGADQLAISTGGVQRATVDSSGRLLVGTSSAEAATIGGLLQIQSTGSTASILVKRNSANSIAPYIYLGKSRGTNNSTTIVSSGDSLGELRFAGADGSSEVGSLAALIKAEVDGTPGANDMPGRLVFSTTPDGSATPVERLRITNDGKVGIGTASPGNLLTLKQTIHAVSDTAPTYIKLENASDGGSAIEFSNAVAGKAKIALGVEGTAGSTDETFVGFSTSFNTTLSEKARITSDGYLRLAGAGIQFNGDTADANSLDDYEEGTWTPIFVPATGSFASITYDSTRAGYYTKIGNCVTVWGTIRTDSVDTTGASGLLSIGGLPFSVGTGTAGGGYAVSLLNWAGEYPNAVRPQPGGTTAYLSYRTTSVGADTISDVSDLTTGTADANRLTFQFSYRV